jgi:hypothetical protein
MHQIFGFNAKNLSPANKNCGFIPVAAMCISVGNYHQGWENPNFSEMMHWI